VSNGGEESACGWCKDKRGLSEQINPLALTESITNSERATEKRVFGVLMQTKKIGIVVIGSGRSG